MSMAGCCATSRSTARTSARRWSAPAWRGTMGAGGGAGVDRRLFPQLERADGGGERGVVVAARDDALNQFPAAAHTAPAPQVGDEYRSRPVLAVHCRRQIDGCG